MVCGIYGITYLYIGGPVPSTSELYRYCTATQQKKIKYHLFE